MEDGRILDSQLTASTQYREGLSAVHARFNDISDSSWSSSFKDVYQWIQVDLGFTKMVSGIVLQGRNSVYMQCVTKYKVMYSDDANSWRWLKDSNGQNDMVRLMSMPFHCFCTLHYVVLHCIEMCSVFK